MPISLTGIWIRIRHLSDGMPKGNQPQRMRVRCLDRFTAQSGFTLIEVVLTIALLALVLGLVLPRINGTPSLSDSSRRLVGVIHSLSTAAAATNRTYRLHVDFTQQAYWSTVMTRDGDRPPSDPSLAFRTTLVSPIKFEDVTTPRSGKVREGKVFVEFFAGGRVDQSVIHLSNQNDRMVALLVNPLTGSVHVSDGYYVDQPKRPVPDAYRQLLTALPLPPPSRLEKAIQP